MSILSELLRDVSSLFFPARCAVCGEPLAAGERMLCTYCRATAPLKQAEDAVLVDTSELDFEESFQTLKNLILDRVGH